MSSAALVLLLLFASQDEPSGPPREPAVHVQAAAVLAIQPAGGPFHRVAPPLSGNAPGLQLGISYSLTPAVEIGGEFVAAGTISAPQRFQYTWVEDYTASIRDLLFNALMRWNVGRTRSLQLVGGAGLARSTFGKGEVTATFPLHPLPPGRGPERYPGWSATSHALALSGGVDLDLRVHPRMSIVPMFRTRWIGRTSTQPATYLGVGRMTYHVGIGIRAHLGG